VSAPWIDARGQSVANVSSVLFTADHRTFFRHEDDTIRLAAEWEQDEVLRQMLAWRDSTPSGVLPTEPDSV